MLIQIVSQYLRSHKRIVIPQLGAFIAKEPGQLLFSELLKRDDGVLRGLLCERGLSELEAAGEIDRLVFEVRHAVERGVGYPLRGLGVMKPGPNETIVFDYDPACDSKSGPAAGAKTPARGEERSAAPVSEGAAPKLPRAPFTDEGRTAKMLSEPNISSSAKLNPEPYVRGLRYGKPQRSTNAYTYVGHSARRKGIDRFLLVAIVAAVIAVAAIAFGYFRNSRGEQVQTPQVEQVQAGVVEAEQSNLE